MPTIIIQINTNYFFLFCFVFIISLVSTLSAQNDSQDIDSSLSNLLDSKIDGTEKYSSTVAVSGNSLYIITADQIKQYGFISLFDAIQYSTDFYFSIDGMGAAGGSRGLIFPASDGVRMPITLNGYQLDDITFTSILNGMPLDFVERIELISGPPSFLFGNGAIFGTINIVTKHGRDFDGGIVFGGINTTGESNANVVLGKKWDNGLDVLLAYKMTHFGGSNKYFEEYDNTHPDYGFGGKYYNKRATNSGVADHRDHYLSNLVFANIQFGNFDFQGMFSVAERGYPDAPFGGIFNDPDATTKVFLNNYALRYNWSIETDNFGKHSITPRIIYSFFENNFRYNYEKEFTIDGVLEKDTLMQWESPIYQTLGFEIKDIWEITPKDVLLVGLNYTTSKLFDMKYDMIFEQKYKHIPSRTTPEKYTDILKPLSIFSSYAEFTREFSSWLTAFAGARYELNQHNKDAFLPRLGMIFSLSDNSTIKALYGTSARNLSGYEEYYNTHWKEDDDGNWVPIVGVDMNYEFNRTLETIYLYNKRNTFFRFSLFYNIMKNIVLLDTLIDGKPDEEYPYTDVNMDPNKRIHNYGISTFIEHKYDFGLSIGIGNMYNSVEVKPDIDINTNRLLYELVYYNAPRNVFIYNLSYKLFDFTYLNILGRLESSRKTYTADGDHHSYKVLAPIHRLNASITYQPAYRDKKYNLLNRFYFSMYFENILNSKDYYPTPSIFGLMGRYPLDMFNCGLNIGVKF